MRGYGSLDRGPSGALIDIADPRDIHAIVGGPRDGHRLAAISFRQSELL